MMETPHISPAKYPASVCWSSGNGAEVEMLYSSKVANNYVFVKMFKKSILQTAPESVKLIVKPQR